jgi:hypothetical protein
VRLACRTVVLSAVIALLGPPAAALASPIAPAFVPASAGAPAAASAAGQIKHHRTARVCSTVVKAGRATCFAIKQTDTVQPAGVSANAVSPQVTRPGYGPSDLASAYKLDQSKGSGQTVAIVDAFDDPNAESDLAAYRTQYGLAPCTTTGGCFTKVSQTGSTTSLPVTDSGWAAEISLDLDMVSATCPNCHILLVEADGPSLVNLGTAVNRAVTLGAKYVSNSYGTSEDGSEPSYDSSYYHHPGVAITASTGDSNYGASYPATGAYVTAVGGTSLIRAINTRGWSETVWNTAAAEGTGSGCSISVAKPWFQTNLTTGCGNRAEADVAAVSDPNTGVAVFDSFQAPGWQVYGGTSAASPIIASVYALAGPPGAADSPNAYPYSHHLRLYDVTSGNNGTCSPAVLCTAGTGWDGPTGLGAPNGSAAFTGQLAGTLVPSSPLRVLDTRSGNGAAKAPVAARGTVHLQVTGRGGVPPSGVSAVVLNVTVAAPAKPGFVTVYGDGTTLPVVSNLNFVAAQSVPNLVIAPVGANGKVALFNGSAGTVQLIADVSGYYLSGAPTVVGAFRSLPPSRLLDTRSGVGAPAAAVAAGGTVHLQVTGRGGVRPSGVSAVVLNVTAAAPTRSGFVTVYGDGMALPVVSNLNFVPGQTVPNLVIAPVGAGGVVDLYNGSAGTVQLIADVSGYYLSGAPAVVGAFGSLPPFRLLNTRTVAAGGTVHLQVTGINGVPRSGVSAVVINVTVTGPAKPGFVTVYGDGMALPVVSNLNFVPGQTVPNLVIAPVGANGKVDLYNGSAGSVHLIADVSGYYLG